MNFDSPELRDMPAEIGGGVTERRASLAGWGRRGNGGGGGGGGWCEEQTRTPRGECSLGVLHVSKSAWRGVRSDRAVWPADLARCRPWAVLTREAWVQECRQLSLCGALSSVKRGYPRR